MTDENPIPAEGENITAEPGATDLQPEIDQAQAQWMELTKNNVREMQSLAQMGAGIDPSYLIRMRLDMFISFIFARMGGTPDDVRTLLTLQFEVGYESAVAEQFRTAKSEIRKATMGLGANVSQDQIKTMWQKMQRGNGGPPPGGGLVT